MKKFWIFLLILILTPMIGGLYGVLHDHFTYSISSEYYTKFKFQQFGLVSNGEVKSQPYPGLLVSVVGFLATWWMGLLIGFILGVIGLIHHDSKQMLRYTLKAIMITIFVAFATGLFGLSLAMLYPPIASADWWLPSDVIDKKNFIAVGMMHNFSYLGGILGMVAGCIYIIRMKPKERSPKTEQEK